MLPAMPTTPASPSNSAYHRESPTERRRLDNPKDASDAEDGKSLGNQSGPHDGEPCSVTDQTSEPEQRTGRDRSLTHAEDERPPAKRSRHGYSNDMITMLVGESKMEFFIHKSILCKTSIFLQNICSQEWKEGKEKVIKLPEVDVEAVSVYIHWLYSGTMDFSLMTGTSSTPGPTSFLNLGKLWILGSFLNDDIFMNQAIDHLLQKLDSAPRMPIASSTVDYLWNLTPPQCSIRRLLLQVIAARSSAKHFETEHELYPREILVEMARRYASRESIESGPSFANRCDYHTHVESETKCQ